MVWLRERVIESELLDTASDADACANLRDLRRINRWLGGHAVVKAEIARCYSPTDAFSVLDVGAAAGDLATSLKRQFPLASIVSCDANFRNLRAAPSPKAAADAFRLPFREHSFDIVTCSLLLHHFSNLDVVSLLRELASLSRRLLLVNDLERHPVAHRFLPATRHVFGWHPITVHDGMRSVAAGFQPGELLALAHRAGLLTARVRRHRPWFRLSLRSVKAPLPAPIVESTYPSVCQSGSA
ncbi:MAG: methyltransferase domain-containing protein [Bryobacterales bacterium]|nr:methyltransferase domain-containing protein [Bryobacterales bacterium]